MLIKLLCDLDRKLLLQLAELMSLADAPLLWDGKTYDEITAKTDLQNISIQENEQMQELLEEIRQSIIQPKQDIRTVNPLF